MLAFSLKLRALVSTALLLTFTLVGAARVQAQVAAASAPAPVAVQVDSPESVTGQSWALFLCLGCAAMFLAGTLGAILPVIVAILANPATARACILICGAALAAEAPQ